MRFFIALEIPEPSRSQLTFVQQKLEQLIPDLKPTEPDKLHLTIAFVGEEDPSFQQPLTEVLNASAQEIPAFSITPAYLDGFPSLHRASILWAGVKGDIDKLFILRERIKDGLVKLQLDVDERRFIPHIALGKIKEFKLSPGEEKQFEDLMENTNFNPIPVTSIKLFESVADKGLHHHNTLAEVVLK